MWPYKHKHKLKNLVQKVYFMSRFEINSNKVEITEFASSALSENDSEFDN